MVKLYHYFQGIPQVSQIAQRPVCILESPYFVAFVAYLPINFTNFYGVALVVTLNH